MDIRQFTEELKEMIREQTGDRYEIGVKEIRKNNDTSQLGLFLRRDSRKAYPVIYLEEIYARYLEGEEISRLAEEIVSVHEMMGVDLDVEFFRDFGQVRDRIYIKLVNYEKNRELLKHLSHIRWFDLAQVFYYSMELPNGETASMMICRPHLVMWDITEEELHRVAGENMARDMQGQLMTMAEVLAGIVGTSADVADQDLGGIPMYVLTNQRKYYGASTVLYSGRVRELAERLESDLLILPSSVHEVLLIKDDCGRDYKEYRQMIREVNASVVDPQEVLSDSLYRYSREQDAVEMIAA